MKVQPGTVVVYTDVVCGWSTIALHRFYREREKAGLTDDVRVDLRLFTLEDVNRFPIPKRFLDAEIPVLGSIEPDFGWVPWQSDPSTWPITSLPANEAVHAAKQQSLAAAEEFDMAIRHAFFTDSRPISLIHELVDIAAHCPGVDADQIAEALDTGSARAAMMHDYREHVSDVQGSPHFFLADGSDVHNPGIELHWVGEPGAGFPVIDSDDKAAFARLVEQASR
ncbi:dithiol-disulfide isomerase [Mycobacterium sp. GA-1841]|uniref:DsbA family oxidoreductase n=1 Tax=Mycobacterium sp. GA-1841 TaxID=1834154 RepID=UPI00096D0542|nr:DsbA family protein [Mycobacterium sp. GA-1841]OMC41957.1 dithiol-disulfide isomerase [Mycobacterium sp. GA-1841]